jgi:hypothetical protein
MQFQVPQFIEVEDKIFGPLTFQQFIYVAGGVGIAVACYLTMPFILAVIVGVPFLALGAALAFLKINERPFVDVLGSAFEYLLGSKLYIWMHRNAPAPTTPAPEEAEKVDAMRYVPTMSQSKIKDLAWSLDIKESMYSDRKQR